jgi:hypothetical protein
MFLRTIRHEQSERRDDISNTSAVDVSIHAVAALVRSVLQRQRRRRKRAWVATR